MVRNWRTYTVAVLAAVGVAVMSAPALADPPFEPNDLEEQAVPLQAGADYRGAIEVPNDYDWFVFYLRDSQQVQIMAAAGLPNSWLGLSVDGPTVDAGGYNPHGVDDVWILTDTPTVVTETLGPGRYFIVLEGSSRTLTGPYAFRVDGQFTTRAGLEASLVAQVNEARALVTKARAVFSRAEHALRRAVRERAAPRRLQRAANKAQHAQNALERARAVLQAAKEQLADLM